MSQAQFIANLNSPKNVEQLTQRILAIIDEQDMIVGKHKKLLSECPYDEESQSYTISPQIEVEFIKLENDFQELFNERVHIRQQISQKLKDCLC